ncbi:MAG: threo-3-hydroxy-L-aspartate ammonia-lyase [Gemmatimonadetes bacterium]|nr:threo-3-hydroxy-L-aspartate ammonia-lyase [Gemmatimonadota bacterium]
MVESSSGPELPTLESVHAAARRLEGVANRTPVVTSRTLNERVGAEVFLKCENLQRAGAFKFRGAYNAIAALSEAERSRGVLTFSSGNHAQAVALVGRLLGIQTVIVMPQNAPRSKLAATRGYGAEVILYDPEESTREAIAESLREERGMAIVPPYDHPEVVAGQGTAALELLAEVGPLDLLVAPCGGGGLLSGTALAGAGSSGCRVVGVEPELADDATRSFTTGTLQTVRNPPTVADGLRTPSLGKVTWPLVRSNVSAMVTVTEAEIVEAMRFLWTRMKLVVEPSGAVALGGVLNRGIAESGERVGVVISGGNVDLSLACALLSDAEPIQ